MIISLLLDVWHKQLCTGQEASPQTFTASRVVCTPPGSVTDDLRQTSEGCHCNHVKSMSEPCLNPHPIRLMWECLQCDLKSMLHRQMQVIIHMVAREATPRRALQRRGRRRACTCRHRQVRPPACRSSCRRRDQWLRPRPCHLAHSQSIMISHTLEGLLYLSMRCDVTPPVPERHRHGASSCLQIDLLHARQMPLKAGAA